jgi:Cu/Ag efflux protein CusF
MGKTGLKGKLFKVFTYCILISLTILSSAFADSHSTTGVIEKIKDNGGVLVIQHEEFPGFMGSMTMPFQLIDPALSSGFAVGDHVEFTIQKTDTGYPITVINRLDDGS